MDRVRFGRALGKGARLAARTAVEAMEAAAAPSTDGKPEASRAPVTGAAPQRQVTVIPPPQRRQPQAVAESPLHRVAPAARSAGGKFLAPLRNASHALWLEFTGSFFALFAFSFGLGAWRSRGAFASHLPAAAHRFETFCALAALFSYFSISSFLRARKRSR